MPLPGSLLAELKRRHVFRVAAMYVVAAWVVVQVAATVFPLLRLPDWSATLVLALAALGFPLALVLAWAYDLTPTGVVRADPAAMPADVASAGPDPADRHAGGGAAARRESTDSARSLAVLPFVNMSADADNEYFCDGLAEELLNALAKVGELKVAARTSAFSFKGRNASIGEIAGALNVRTVLEGSVRKAGDRVRISVQLVDAADGYHLWAERYDRSLRDIFDVQDEIALAVVDALRLRLLGTERAAVLKRGTSDPEAMELYLRGLYHWNRRTPDDMARSVGLFRQAVARDPEYALAYVGLADAYLLLGIYGGTPSAESLGPAREAAERALRLDGSLAEAHASLGHYHFRALELEACARECERAIQLGPRYPVVRVWYAEYFRATRRFDEALREIRVAQALDPRSHIIGCFVGEALFNTGQTEAALAEWRRVAELAPEFATTHIFLARGYADLGRGEEAIVASGRAVELTGRGAFFLAYHGYALARAGRREEALAVADELVERHAAGRAAGVLVAFVHAGLDDRVRAVAWIERDVQAANTSLLHIAAHPVFHDRLRTDPRYAELLWRIGLAPQLPDDAARVAAHPT